MKHLSSTLFSVIFCISVLLLLPVKSFGQLSGSYTINPTRTATASNYQNWASAVGDLLNGSRTDGGSAQGPGVSSAVSITVYDTTYNTAIELTAINGASYTNTITFKSTGGIASKCMLANPSSSSATNDYVLSLNGVDYVTFQDIGFERTSANQYCNVVVISGNAVKNKLIGCLLKGKKQVGSQTLGFQYGPGSVIYFTGNGDSTQITQSQIMYGYNGIFSTSASTGVTISGNTIDTSGSSGIYMTGQTSLRILGNTFNMGDFGPGKGHYVSYGFRIETSASMVAAGNKIYMSAVNCGTVRAIVIAGVTSTAAAPAMVYNNTLVNIGGTTECTGFAVYGTYYLDITYNNVLILNSLANASAYYHYAGYANSNITLTNNNLINKGGGLAINAPGTNTGDLDTVDYNNVYTSGTNVANWGGTPCSKLSDLQSTSSKSANSISFDPGFISNSNLHVSNIKLNGRALYDSRIRTDIDGETRDNSTPDIGADEFFPGNIDIGVANLDSPYLFSASKHMVKVSFQNYGFDTIKSAQIQWQVNGSTQSAYNWSGTVAPGASSSSIPLGYFTFSANTSYTFKIWTRLPNNKSDEKNINDTLKITRIPALAGNYTIGDTSGTSFKSFNQAITAMTSRGISNAITFSVLKGIYPEQLTLVQLPGMGASNPVTFQNATKDSTKVILTLSSTTATGSNNAVVQLRGANYVTFKGITFERTGASTNIGHVVHIFNGAHHNTFTNCQMLGLLNGTAANGLNIWSDQSKDDYNTFRNNRIRFGFNNMQYLGTAASHETGTVIEGNIFENGVNNSVLVQYNDSITVKGNTFLNVNTHVGGNYDIQLSDCDKGISVDGNFHRSTNIDTSIWLSGCNATASRNGNIANNAIIRNYGKGIFLDGVDYQNVVFNSIYYNGNLPSNAAIVSSSATSGNIVLKNNNIVMDGGDVFYISDASHLSASNNNNLLTKGGQFAYLGAAYTSLSLWVSGTGMDNKSMSVNPLFISGTNLHIKNYLLKGKGVPVTGVTKDMDGEMRHATTPDIGADEFKLVPDDAGIILLLKPIAGVCAGTWDVEAVIKNFGNDNLKSATINWSINGTFQNPYSWSGNLVTNATDTVLVGNFNFSTAFNPRFFIKASQPNGMQDGISINDSIIVTRTLRALPSVDAGPDLTICLGDSATIGTAASTGHNYKWTTISGTVIGTSAEIMVKPTVKTKYILEMTNIAFGCVNKDTVELSLNTKPVADAGTDKTICPGNTARIGATTQSGFTYTWSSVPAGFSSSTADPVVSPTQTTTYMLEKTVTGSGCKGIDTVVVSVSPLPLPQITGKYEVCNDDIINYTTTLNASNTYNWIASGGTITSGQNTNSINLRWDTTGVGVVKVIETTAASCFDTTEYYVTVFPNPTADFSFKGTCLTALTTFTNLSTGANSYIWTFGDGTSFTKENPPGHTYPLAISYNARLIAKNNDGCSDTVTKLLPIDPLPVAGFSNIQKTGYVMEFTNTSTIPSGIINSWHWRFGDGDTSILQNPAHKYGSPANASVTLCVKSAQGCENCLTKQIGFTGVKNIESDPGLFIYPNPGSGIFTIHSSGPMISVDVTNSMGQLIEMYAPIATQFKFDLSGKPMGVYFIKIDMEGGSQVLRVIKE